MELAITFGWTAAAVTISCLALVLTFIEGISNRKHNRLSVEPHLVLDTDRRDESNLKYILTNHGLGPALIEGFALKYGPATYTDIPDPDATYAKIIHRMTESDEVSFEYKMLHQGEALSPGSTRDLLTLDFSKMGPSDQEKAKNRVGTQLEISIKYSSIYKGKQKSVRSVVYPTTTI